MSFLQKTKKLYNYALASSTLLVTDFALASTEGGGSKGFAALSGNLNDQMQAGKQVMMSFAFFMGVLVCLGGCLLIYKDSKQPGQDHLKKGIVALIVGGLLVGLPSVISLSSATVLNENNDKFMDAYN